jgi:hypothetical protein
MFNDLNDSNVMLYAAKCYNTPNCIQSEFEEDFKTVRYIKRLLNKYKQTGEIKETLMLNHLNLLQNVFGIEATARILFCKVDAEDYGTLKAFLIFLSSMPDVVRGINGKDIYSSDIRMDSGIVSVLRDKFPRRQK